MLALKQVECDMIFGFVKYENNLINKKGYRLGGPPNPPVTRQKSHFGGTCSPLHQGHRLDKAVHFSGCLLD